MTLLVTIMCPEQKIYFFQAYHIVNIYLKNCDFFNNFNIKALILNI